MRDDYPLDTKEVRFNSRRSDTLRGDTGGSETSKTRESVLVERDGSEGGPGLYS